MGVRSFAITGRGTTARLGCGGAEEGRSGPASRSKDQETLLASKRTVYVHVLRRRHPYFPPPVAKLSAGLVWDWEEVEKWARATGRIK